MIHIAPADERRVRIHRRGSQEPLDGRSRGGQLRECLSRLGGIPQPALEHLLPVSPRFRGKPDKLLEQGARPACRDLRGAASRGRPGDQSDDDGRRQRHDHSLECPLPLRGSLREREASLHGRPAPEKALNIRRLGTPALQGRKEDALEMFGRRRSHTPGQPPPTLVANGFARSSRSPPSGSGQPIPSYPELVSTARTDAGRYDKDLRNRPARGITSIRPLLH